MTEGIADSGRPVTTYDDYVNAQDRRGLVPAFRWAVSILRTGRVTKRFAMEVAHDLVTAAYLTWGVLMLSLLIFGIVDRPDTHSPLSTLLLALAIVLPGSAVFVSLTIELPQRLLQLRLRRGTAIDAKLDEELDRGSLSHWLATHLLISILGLCSVISIATTWLIR